MMLGMYGLKCTVPGTSWPLIDLRQRILIPAIKLL